MTSHRLRIAVAAVAYALACAILVGVVARSAADVLTSALPFSHDHIAKAIVLCGLLTAAWYCEAAAKAAVRIWETDNQ